MWSPGPHDDLGGTDLKMGTRMGEGAVPTPSSWARLGGLFGFISGTPILNFWVPFSQKSDIFDYLHALFGLQRIDFSKIFSPKDPLFA